MQWQQSAVSVEWYVVSMYCTGTVIVPYAPTVGVRHVPVEKWWAGVERNMLTSRHSLSTSLSSSKQTQKKPVKDDGNAMSSIHLASDKCVYDSVRRKLTKTYSTVGLLHNYSSLVVFDSNFQKTHCQLGIDYIVRNWPTFNYEPNKKYDHQCQDASVWFYPNLHKKGHCSPQVPETLQEHMGWYLAMGDIWKPKDYRPKCTQDRTEITLVVSYNTVVILKWCIESSRS